MARKTKKRTIPENADLKCKDCGSTKFSVHVVVQPNGDINLEELECAECAVTQVDVGRNHLIFLKDEYITTTLEDDRG